MKRRLLIVLAIVALLSLTVLAACDTHEHKWSPNHDDSQHWQECECNEKKDKADHALSWKSDAANHWQECGSCDFKSTPAAHVDVKNNETQAEGADGKCDVCAHEIFAVTFDMQGHGKAVAAQSVGKGGKATAPSVEDDDAWKFGGWYKEASCEHEFDFANEVINEATTVYAKWTEDTTEGASKAHAYELVLDVESANGIKKDVSNYYVYTAANEGRYTVSLGSGVNSLKCSFVTDKTGDAVYDKDNSSVSVDLNANEKVYVILSCAEDLGSEALVGVLVEVCSDEPLSADVYPSGEYANGAYNFSFDHDTKIISDLDNEWNEVAKYVGGKYNTLTFVHSDNTYVISLREDGSYSLSINGGESRILQFYAKQDPIPVAKFYGLYKPADASKLADGISEIGIYEDGNGYYLQNNHKYDQEIGKGASYNQSRNALTYGQYVLTLNLEGENVVSINVLGGSMSAPVVYNRDGEPLPQALPLSYNQYVGQNLLITKNEYGAGHRWGEYGYSGTIIEISAYDEESGLYTVNGENEDEVYKLKIVGNSVEVYDETGANKVDTLAAFIPVFHDMPADGVALTINKSDLQKKFYWIKVSESGWYNIVASGEQTVVYVGLSEEAPDSNLYNAKQAGEQAIKLEADVIIGVYLGDYEEIPDSVALTITATEAPAGMDESNPLDLVDGRATFENMDNENVYYFRCVGLKVGAYVVGCTYLSYGNVKSIHYVINDAEYGYNNQNWQYSGGVTAAFPYAAIVLEEDGDLLIAADRIKAYGTENISVIVAPDYRRGATAIENASGTLEAGNYKIEDLSDVASLVLGVGESQVTLTKDDLLFGIKLDESVSYVINYVEGSAKNPVKINANGTVNVLGGQYVLVTAPTGQDTLISLGSASDDYNTYYFSFVYNDVTYGYGYNNDNGRYYPLDKVSLAIAAGQSVLILVNEDKSGAYNQDIPVIVSEDYTAGAIDVELVKGEPANDKIVASAAISASGTYNISSIGSALNVTSSAAFTIKPIGGEDIVATEANGVYSAVIPSSVSYFKVTLANGQSLALSVEYAKGSEEYPDEVQLVDDSANITVDADVIYYFTLPAGIYSYDGGRQQVNILLNGEPVYAETITVKDGDVVAINGGWWGAEVVITKQGDVPAPIEGTTYEGTYSESGRKVVFTVNADYTKGHLTIIDTASNDTVVDQDVDISFNEGVYLLMYMEEGQSTIVKFMLSRAGDESIMWSDGYVNQGKEDFADSFVLNKKVEENPDVPEVQGSTYKGSDTETNREVILTIDEGFFTSSENHNRSSLYSQRY